MKDVAKPIIHVTSKDEDPTFEWMSEDWNREEVRDTPKAKRLFRKAKACIKAAADPLDAIKRLEQAGFQIVRHNPFKEC